MSDPSRRISRVWPAVQASACALALLGLLLSVETVVVTGPVLFAIGLLQIVLGVRSRRLMVVGMGNCAVVCLVAGIIVLFQLRPAEALVVVLPTGLVWMMASTAYALYIPARSARPRRRKRQERLPWDCAACGYPLIGVGGNTCPECGHLFDARELRRLMREMAASLGEDTPPHP